MLSPVFEETEAGEQLIQLRGDVPAPGARPDQLQPPPVHRHIGLPDLENAATRIQSKYRKKRSGENRIIRYRSWDRTKNS